MGVMECDRLNCDHILCDHYSNEYGYLCDGCYSELLESTLAISDFMITKKDIKEEDYDTREEYIRSQFS